MHLQRATVSAPGLVWVVGLLLWVDIDHGYSYTYQATGFGVGLIIDRRRPKPDPNSHQLNAQLSNRLKARPISPSNLHNARPRYMTV